MSALKREKKGSATTKVTAVTSRSNLGLELLKLTNPGTSRRSGRSRHGSRHTAAAKLRLRPREKKEFIAPHIPFKMYDPSPKSPRSQKRKLVEEEATPAQSTSKPMKILSADRSCRIGIVVNTLKDLRSKIPKNIAIGTDQFEIVLEEDCTRVDDEEYFQTLPENTVLMAVSRSEEWTKASSSLAAEYSGGHVEVDGPVSGSKNHLSQVAGRIARNPAIMAFLPKVDLEVVRDSNIRELQVLLRQSKEDAQFIQDACERRLTELNRSDEASALLKLYHRAKTETKDGSSVEPETSKRK